MNSLSRSLLSVFTLVIYIYDNSVTARPQYFNETQTSSSLLATSDEDSSLGQIPHILESRAISGTALNGNRTHNITDDDEYDASKVSEFDGPIRKCSHANNKALNQCLKQILKDLKPRIAIGVPEINLPPMDPLQLKNVRFQHGSGPIKVIASFSNVEATGLSHYNKSDFVVDMARRVLDFDLGVPHMQVIGDYELSGNLFFFPVGGTGSFWLQLGGIDVKGHGQLGVVTREDGHKGVELSKIELELEIQSLRVHLSNLFNGDQLLGPVLNNFLNENGLEIFEEIRPQIGVQVGEMVQLLTNRALGALSPEHFADIPEETTA